MAIKKVVTKTRRGNNEGSIYRRKDGRWTGSLTIGVDENGRQKRKTVYGQSKIEVAQKLSDLTDIIVSLNDDLNKCVLADVMVEWIMVYKKSQVSPRSFENYIRLFRIYIEPNIGGMRVSEIDDMTVLKLLNSMQERGLSVAYIKKCKHLLRQFFEYAEKKNMLRTNPLNGLKLKIKERKVHTDQNEYKALPPEIRRKFMDCLGNTKLLKPLCYLMMFAGLRTGEALALKWRDVNFDEAILNVDRALTFVPKFDEEGKVVERLPIIGDTKTACSVRQVPMPEILSTAILEYRLLQEQKKTKYNIDLTDSNSFVFCNDDGTYRTYSGTKAIFYRFLKKYALTEYRIHFHTLRHTYANILFESHKNPKAIQQLLGHKAVSTTITTYNSVNKEDLKHATSIFNDLFRVDDIQEKIEKPPEADNMAQLIKSLSEKDLGLLVERIMSIHADSV